VDHSRYIGPRLAVGWNAAIFVYRRRASVVGRQRQSKIVVVVDQQRVQVGGTAAHILVWLETVSNTKFGGRTRHQLHQSARAGAAHGAGIPAAFRPDQTGKQVHIEVVVAARLGKDFVQVRW
jgi:hypothetical protein